MRKTTKEISESTDAFAFHKWLSDATLEEIWQLLPYMAFQSHDFHLARARLDILISQTAETLGKRIINLTWALLLVTVGLLVTAVAQIIFT